MPIANSFAYFMLVAWPVVAWIFFTKMAPARALVWTILGGYMILPPVIAINLPMVPDFNKYTIPNLAAAFAVAFLLKERISLWPESRIARGLIVLYVASPFATVLQNGDPLSFVQASIPGMRLYDSLAVVANQLITLLPFFLARKYLTTPDSLRVMIVALVVAGLIYSVPMLIESRLSPQLNLRVYGFFQHDFSQTFRFGGYRPFVFMPHGLWVAFFAMMCLVASVVLCRDVSPNERVKYALVVMYLAVILLLCRSAGPWLYALLLVPMVMVVPRKLQLVVAAVMVTLVISYPLLRGLHLVPVDQILHFAGGVNEERGQSLGFRLLNEELLLDRAQEKAWFGWGNYGRNMLRDPVTGQINVIADGGWVLVLGMFGWTGYIAQFGLLALPVLLIAREGLAVAGRDLSPFVCAITLILAANLVDLLPNDTLIPFTWLMAGAVLGHAESLYAARRRSAVQAFNLEFKPRRTVL